MTPQKSTIWQLRGEVWLRRNTKDLRNMLKEVEESNCWKQESLCHFFLILFSNLLCNKRSHLTEIAQSFPAIRLFFLSPNHFHYLIPLFVTMLIMKTQGICKKEKRLFVLTFDKCMPGQITGAVQLWSTATYLHRSPSPLPTHPSSPSCLKMIEISYLGNMEPILLR